jgi:1,4-dihydroxy-2-naphthoate octaprenyltransferase
MKTAFAESPAPSRALAWWLALRPWSFTISLAPVLAGTGLAVFHGYPPDFAIAAVALLACVLIHAGTNLQNDVGDFRRGADLSGRIGPPRVTTQGWLPAREVQAAATLSFALAVVPGAWLAVRGGWPIVAVGLASIAAGAAYTAGRRPVAYSGWGEAFVIVFFGVVAVAGMYYLHSGRVAGAPLVAGVALGLLAAAVLVVNNLRDIDSDRRVGKNTLAVRLGRRFSVWEYAALMHLPFVLSIGISLLEREPWLLAPLALLPWATTLAQRVRREPAGAGLNAVLASTAKLGLTYALLLGVAGLVQV